MPFIKGAPTQINFFLMSKKIGIKTFQVFINGTSYKKTSTRSPKYFTIVVVLSVIFFQSFKNTSATIRITVFVYKSARCTGIFKVFFALEIQKFGLDYGCF